MYQPLGQSYLGHLRLFPFCGSGETDLVPRNQPPRIQTWLESMSTQKANKSSGRAPPNVLSNEGKTLKCFLVCVVGGENLEICLPSQKSDNCLNEGDSGKASWR